MSSSAATSASMDLTRVILSLLDGIVQELGLEPKEFKIVLVANEDQTDPSPFQSLHQHYTDLEWGYQRFNAWENPETYLEIQLKNDNLLTHPHTRSQQSIACDVKSSNQFTDGSSPVSLYQVGSYGSCLSALRSKMICTMEGNFQGKGAPRMGELKHFQTGSHVNQQVSEKFLGSPLPVKTFLHIHTWQTRYPKSAEYHSLEFDIKYAGIAGIAFNLSTLIQHKWNNQVDWCSSIADVDLLSLYQKRNTMESRLYAMGLDPSSLPVKTDPNYCHVVAGQNAQAPQHQSSMRALLSVLSGPSSTITCPTSSKAASSSAERTFVWSAIFICFISTDRVWGVRACWKKPQDRPAAAV